MKLPRLLPWSLFVASAFAADAAPLSYEGYSYPSGVLTRASGGSGWVDAWIGGGETVRVGSTSLAYRDAQGVSLATAGGSLEITGNAQVKRVFSTPLLPPASGRHTVWMAFLARKDPAEDGVGEIRLFGKGSSVPVGTPWEKRFWTIASRTPDVDDKANDSESTRLIVLKLDLMAEHNHQLRLFIDPVIAKGAGAPQNSDAVITEFNLRLREIEGIIVGGNVAVLHFDEFRLGEDFESVVPSAK